MLGRDVVDEWRQLPILHRKGFDADKVYEKFVFCYRQKHIDEYRNMYNRTSGAVFYYDNRARVWERFVRRYAK
jgi:hypothetical protein